MYVRVPHKSTFWRAGLDQHRTAISPELFSGKETAVSCHHSVFD